MSGLNLSALGNLSGGLNTQKDLQQLKNYVMQLTEQLRFVLSNIGEENLSSEVKSTITSAAGAVAGKVGADELDTAIKALEQKMDANNAAIQLLIDQNAQSIENLTQQLEALDERVTALEGSGA